jgi:hypothetical protein
MSEPNDNIIRLKKFFPHPNQMTIRRGEGENARLESVPYYSPTLSPLLSSENIQNVGDNKVLQSDVTTFYYNKVLKWIKSYPEFSHLKKHEKFLKTRDGLDYIYNLLRLFVKKSQANWYDLRDPTNYSTVKDYLRFKIGAV